MELLAQVWDIFLHLDVHLNAWAGTLGPWLYVVLFAVVFCETGLVVTPFLPGDSLLFAAGALASRAGSPINLWILIPVIFAAAVIGDSVNYEIGKWLGPKVFTRKDSWLLNQNHLHKAEDILMEDMGCIPVAYYNDFWLQSPSLKGTWHSPYGYWYLQYGYVE